MYSKKICFWVKEEALKNHSRVAIQVTMHINFCSHGKQFFFQLIEAPQCFTLFTIFLFFSESNIVDVEFYFKCHGPDHRADEEGQSTEQAPPLHLIRPNVRQVGSVSS